MGTRCRCQAVAVPRWCRKAAIAGITKPFLIAPGKQLFHGKIFFLPCKLLAFGEKVFEGRNFHAHWRVCRDLARVPQHHPPQGTRSAQQHTQDASGWDTGK